MVFKNFTENMEMGKVTANNLLMLQLKSSLCVCVCEYVWKHFSRHLACTIFSANWSCCCCCYRWNLLNSFIFTFHLHMDARTYIHILLAVCFVAGKAQTCCYCKCFSHLIIAKQPTKKYNNKPKRSVKSHWLTCVRERDKANDPK